MKILLSNDDGYRAAGLTTLYRELRETADVTVVAPDRDRSGSSHSLTLEHPIRAERAGNGFIYVDGTPTDCVHLAITGLLDDEPDIVISGVNAGGNLGDDVLYSGTVAAAMEGRFLGLPAIAVSLAGRDLRHYRSAARVVRRLLRGMAESPIPPDTILNINVPDLPAGQIHGFQVTRLGNRHKAEPVIPDTDPLGRTVYWVGPPGAEQDAGPGTDFHAVKSGYVSVTPMHVDLTRHAAREQMSPWLAGMSLV